MRQFTIIDAIASIALAAIIVAVSQTLLGCGGGGPEVVSDDELAKVRKEKEEKAQQARRGPMNATQLRGIQQGLVLYAQGNNGYYPGLDPRGMPKPAFAKTSAQYGSGGGDGAFPAHRYAILVNGSYFSNEYMVSPFDKGTKTVLAGQAGQANQDVTPDHFSYAMLGIAGNPGRAAEWKDTSNSQAPAVTDRNTGGGSGAAAQSIQSDGEGWVGHIAWNDNHVLLERSSTLKQTRFGTTDFNNDDLFADENAGKDAAMVFQDATTLTNQK